MRIYKNILPVYGFDIKNNIYSVNPEGVSPPLTGYTTIARENLLNSYMISLTQAEIADLEKYSNIKIIDESFVGSLEMRIAGYLYYLDLEKKAKNRSDLVKTAKKIRSKIISYSKQHDKFINELDRATKEYICVLSLEQRYLDNLANLSFSLRKIIEAFDLLIDTAFKESGSNKNRPGPQNMESQPYLAFMLGRLLIDNGYKVTTYTDGPLVRLLDFVLNDILYERGLRIKKLKNPQKIVTQIDIKSLSELSYLYKE